MLEIENSLYKKGYEYIAGVDEAGRGPLAGPVCAAAVILPKGLVIEGINDSKKLSEKKRDMLFDEIISKAVAYSIQFSDPDVIDEINILNASLSGMKKGCIPLTLILVAIFYLGQELYDAIFLQDGISQMTHIIGGLCGTILGFMMRKGSRR